MGGEGEGLAYAPSVVFAPGFDFHFFSFGIVNDIQNVRPAAEFAVFHPFLFAPAGLVYYNKDFAATPLALVFTMDHRVSFREW